MPTVWVLLVIQLLAMLTYPVCSTCLSPVLSNRSSRQALAISQTAVRFLAIFSEASLLMLTAASLMLTATLGYHLRQNKWRQNKTYAGSHEVGFDPTRAKIQSPRKSVDLLRVPCQL